MGEHHLSHGPANRGRYVLQTAAPLFVREPVGAPRGAVIVLHDVFGVTDYAEEACRRLARGGWLAVSPYLYYEHGGPAFDATELPVARGEMTRLTAEGLAADIAGARDYLTGRRGMPAPAVLGFSMGGYLATWAAAHHDLAGAVAVSPSGVEHAPWAGMAPLELLVADRRAPWLGVLGRDDRRLPPDAPERLRLAAAASGPHASVVLLPEAGHGFYRTGRPGHAPHADTEAWRRITAFLARFAAP
ncbi:dienelactone hydrolase family protein [Actinomadura miaoliensis]|uniref:Dienelactone hydrolase domain-containing protein n=1 Tax=Actinomadura miaoliensis TaxID=430685 RepID=A0ABP7WI27_9ACTN